MSFFQKIEVIWQNVSIVQRVLLTATVLTVVAISALLVHWARRPDMGLLYSNLDTEEAAKITDKISEKGIAYKLATGGTTIYAPKENIAQLRLDMAKEGLPQGGQKGYRIFDNEKIGISPFVQNVNLKRALQDELAKSIQMIDGVSHARVHIVNTEQTVFTSGGPQQTSASVVLRLKPGYRPSALNIAAITHLVAGSVEGLKSENITVVDSQGHLLSGTSDQIMTGGAGTVADYRERVEQSLANKVEDMLTAVLGPGRATVQVSAEVDMTRTNLVTKSYTGKGVTVNEEIKEKSKTPEGKVDSQGKPVTSGGKEVDNTITSQKLFDENVETTTELPGEIKSLTVAAVVDLEVEAAAETGEEGEQAKNTTQTTKIMEKQEVEKLIENALGLKIPERDSLQVTEAKFNRPTEVLAGAEEAGGLDFIAIAHHSSLGIMAICVLIVFKMFGKARKKAAETTMEQLPGAIGQTAGLLPAGAEGSESLMLRKQIASTLRSNPEQAKQLFSSWLEEKGG